MIVHVNNLFKKLKHLSDLVELQSLVSNEHQFIQVCPVETNNLGCLTLPNQLGISNDKNNPSKHLTSTRYCYANVKNTSYIPVLITYYNKLMTGISINKMFTFSLLCQRADKPGVGLHV